MYACFPLTLHTHLYILLNRIKNVHLYIHIQIHYAYAYKLIQYVLSEKGGRQQLLRANLMLAKHPTSTTHYVLLLTFNFTQS